MALIYITFCQKYQAYKNIIRNQKRNDGGIWMSKKDDIYLHHILNSISKIKNFTEGINENDFKKK